jgi:hypothetical protein
MGGERRKEHERFFSHWWTRSALAKVFTPTFGGTITFATAVHRAACRARAGPPTTTASAERAHTGRSAVASPA